MLRMCTTSKRALSSQLEVTEGERRSENKKPRAGQNGKGWRGTDDVGL